MGMLCHARLKLSTRRTPNPWLIAHPGCMGRHAHGTVRHHYAMQYAAVTSSACALGYLKPIRMLSARGRRGFGMPAESASSPSISHSVLAG